MQRLGSRKTRTTQLVNYLRALNHAIKLLETYPICHKVVREAHEILLSGLSNSRGAQKRPGEYKSEQNWIGGGRDIENARFVPPPPLETQKCMDELEAYINEEGKSRAMHLIDLALVHYQIETIHPFADGNGRVGRMIISLMAMQNDLLEMPVLYMSPAIENEKDEYIDLMFNVSARGEWTPWLKFFLSKVEAACLETVATIDRLIALQESFRAKAADAMRSTSIISIVDSLFEVPVISIPEAEQRLGMTYAGASKPINKLVELGILVELPDRYPKTFIAPAILRATEPE